MNYCHTFFDEVCKKHFDPSHKSFTANPKALLVRDLPRPEPLKLDKPTIKFKKNKLTNRFEVFRVSQPVQTSKKRKNMEIETDEEDSKAQSVTNDNGSSAKITKESTSSACPSFLPIYKKGRKDSEKFVRSPSSVFVQLNKLPQNRTLQTKIHPMRRNTMFPDRLLPSSDEEEEKVDARVETQDQQEVLPESRQRRFAEFTLSKDEESQTVGFKQTKKKALAESCCQTSPIPSRPIITLEVTRDVMVGEEKKDIFFDLSSQTTTESTNQNIFSNLETRKEEQQTIVNSNDTNQKKEDDAMILSQAVEQTDIKTSSPVELDKTLKLDNTKEDNIEPERINSHQESTVLSSDNISRDENSSKKKLFSFQESASILTSGTNTPAKQDIFQPSSGTGKKTPNPYNSKEKNPLDFSQSKFTFLTHYEPEKANEPNPLFTNNPFLNSKPFEAPEKLQPKTEVHNNATNNLFKQQSNPIGILGIIGNAPETSKSSYSFNGNLKAVSNLGLFELQTQPTPPTNNTLKSSIAQDTKTELFSNFTGFKKEVEAVTKIAFNSKIESPQSSFLNPLNSSSGNTMKNSSLANQLFGAEMMDISENSGSLGARSTPFAFVNNQNTENVNRMNISNGLFQSFKPQNTNNFGNVNTNNGLFQPAGAQNMNNENCMSNGSRLFQPSKFQSSNASQATNNSSTQNGLFSNLGNSSSQMPSNNGFNNAFQNNLFGNTAPVPSVSNNIFPSAQIINSQPNNILFSHNPAGGFMNSQLPSGNFQQGGNFNQNQSQNGPFSSMLNSNNHQANKPLFENQNPFANKSSNLGGDPFVNNYLSQSSQSAQTYNNARSNGIFPVATQAQDATNFLGVTNVSNNTANTNVFAGNTGNNNNTNQQQNTARVFRRIVQATKNRDRAY